MTEAEKITKLSTEISRLNKIIAKDLSDNDDLGAEYTYVVALKDQITICIQALELIAAPKRPDGTYNRDRHACEVLARETLAKLEGGGG